MAAQLHEIRDLAAPGGEPFVLTPNSAINWLYLGANTSLRSAARPRCLIGAEAISQSEG